MSLISYRSTFDFSITSRDIETNTSSQILLSRGVAGPPAESFSLPLATAPPLDVIGMLESAEECNMPPTESMEATSEVHLSHEPFEALGGGATRILNYLTAVDYESADALSSANTSTQLVAREDVSFSTDCTSDNIFGVDDLQEPGRRRTLERTTRHASHLPSAGSVSRKQKRLRELANEVCAEVMDRRKRRSTTMLESRSPVEDELLEPYPYKSICHSVSAVMSESTSGTESDCTTSIWVNDTWWTSSGLAKEERLGEICKSEARCQHASVFGALGLPSNLPLEETFQPPPLFTPLDYELANSPYLWSATDVGQPAAAPEVRVVSTASQIPFEIIHRIYYFLGPVDFNSARHASRSWFINSLDRRLLETMLHRGAYLAVLHRELSIKGNLHPRSRISDEWLMSKILSRECALGPDWTGDGISKSDVAELSNVNTHVSRSAFRIISESDFRGAGINYPGTTSRVSGLVFTTSTCGKFVTVAHGCLVFIYELNRSHIIGHDDEHLRSGAIKPVTTVICPRRVIACSMDTSCNRKVVAILMDDRMGLVCPISTSASIVGNAEEPRSQGLGHAHLTVRASRRSQINMSLRGAAQMKAAPNPCPPPSRKAFHMEIESSAPSIYSPLCTVDDPPRSVALCPQRCCVAFGCSTGIELHWVDAMTGQDLSRWFPLTTPSDYLYFLPPRDGLDTAKKLRLISSAGRPGERIVIADRYSSGDNASPQRSRRLCIFDKLTSQGSIGRMTDSFSNSVLNVRLEPGRDNTDHFRAVPVADGYHILFTDPLTGFLCLGTDAPVGGPTKLYRKICFKVPPEHGSPVVYGSGNDLRHGLKIAAAYGIGREQTIWFFSVPADAFIKSQVEAGCTSWATELSWAHAATTPGCLPWQDRSVERTEPWEIIDPEPSIRAEGIGATPIRGQLIGKMQDVVDLAVDSGPQMTVWAFARNGIAKTWKLDDGSWDGRTRKRIITRDGSVRDADGEGDVEMTTAAHVARDGQTFDGAASLQLAQPRFTDSHASLCDHAVRIDADGDAFMKDSPCCGRAGSYGETLTSRPDANWVPGDDVGFSSHFYKEQASRTEFVEQVTVVESTRVARIDIDIR